MLECQQVSNMLNKLNQLLDVSTEMITEKDLKKNLIKLTDTIKKLLNSDICSIFLHDDEKSELWTIVAQIVDEIRLPDDKGIAGYVYRHAELLNIPDAYQDERFDKDVDKNIGYKTNNILAIPLIDKNGETFGVLEVVNKLDGSQFTQDDIDLLSHVTLYASSIIENSILHEKLKATSDDLIYKLSFLTKYKEPRSRFHIIRVGYMSEIIARAYGFSKEEADVIKNAAFMHDIGKIGIKDEVIQKIPELTRVEWDMIKNHTIYGYNILKDEESHVLQIASVIALEHHERWNGSGYPYGKKGKDVTIHARICGIVDAFDSMSMEKPYRPPFSIEESFETIKRSKGTYFDPDLVRIFVDNFNKILKLKKEYPDGN